MAELGSAQPQLVMPMCCNRCFIEASKVMDDLVFYEQFYKQFDIRKTIFACEQGKLVVYGFICGKRVMKYR